MLVRTETATVHGLSADQDNITSLPFRSECEGNNFKPKVGNTERCRACGLNTLVVQKMSCKCKEGYFRKTSREDIDEENCFSKLPYR